MWRDERRPGRAKGFADAALRTREHRGRDATNVFVRWRRIEAFSERRHEHAEVYDRAEAKEIDVRKDSRVHVYRVDRRHPAYDLIRHPMLARQMRVQGSVILQALIGRDGMIQNLRILSGPPILANAAEEAVRQWHFKPHYVGSQPVETRANITVNFTISTN